MDVAAITASDGWGLGPAWPSSGPPSSSLLSLPRHPLIPGPGPGDRRRFHHFEKIFQLRFSIQLTTNSSNNPHFTLIIRPPPMNARFSRQKCFSSCFFTRLIQSNRFNTYLPTYTYSCSLFSFFCFFIIRRLVLVNTVCLFFSSKKVNRKIKHEPVSLFCSLVYCSRVRAKILNNIPFLD
jgi:hypothetical protein